MPKVMWTCPACGKQFVTKDMWHSCVRRTVDDFFDGKSPQLRDLYDAYIAFVENSLGPVIVNVDKTRITFQTRTRFAGVAGLRKNALIGCFWLKRKIESDRFSRVEFIPPNNWVYQFRIEDDSGFDSELEAWLREALLVGNQES